MIKELIKIANELDSRGLKKEADTLDRLIKSAGKRVVEKIGDIKIYKDTEWGEYVVVPTGEDLDAGYHTDDLEDAIDTARLMDQGSKPEHEEDEAHDEPKMHGRKEKEYKATENLSRGEQMFDNLLNYLGSDESTEDAIDFIKGLLSKKSSLESSLAKSAASTHDMVDHDIRTEQESAIAALVLKEAMRRANRDDISREMIAEFLEDTIDNISKLIITTTEDLKTFNTEPFSEELEEPTEIVERPDIEPNELGFRYNPNKPWDALFPPKE